MATSPDYKTSFVTMLHRSHFCQLAIAGLEIGERYEHAPGETFDDDGDWNEQFIAARLRHNTGWNTRFDKRGRHTIHDHPIFSVAIYGEGEASISGFEGAYDHQLDHPPGLFALVRFGHIDKNSQERRKKKWYLRYERFNPFDCQDVPILNDGQDLMVEAKTAATAGPHCPIRWSTLHNQTFYQVQGWRHCRKQDIPTRARVLLGKSELTARTTFLANYGQGKEFFKGATL